MISALEPTGQGVLNVRVPLCEKHTFCHRCAHTDNKKKSAGVCSGLYEHFSPLFACDNRFACWVYALSTRVDTDGYTHTHICLFLALGLHTHPQGAHQLPSWEGERGTSVGGLEAVVLSEMDVINTCWVDRETDPWESQLASQKSLLSLFLSVSWWSSFTQSNTFKRQERHFQGDQRHFSHYFSTEGSWNQIYRIKQRQCSEKPLNNN